MAWYLSYGGQRIGPMDEEEARQKATQNPEGYAWKDGFPDWVPIRDLAELRPTASLTPPPPRGGRAADEIDYRIYGEEMQYVEIELDPGESAVAEAGAMMYKDPQIQMESILGDGSSSGGGFMDKLLGAGKRILTGESLFMTLFTHRGSGKARVAFAAPFPGTIIPVSLPQVGGTLICQKDSFLCAAKGVSIGIYFQKKVMTGLFGGEGFILEKLEGTGMAFVHAGGSLVERELAPGQELHFDTGCLAAMSPTVQFDVQQAGNIKTMLFGGEGLCRGSLRGPGKVWLQSLPVSRLAGRMMAGAVKHKEEGSILGPLGNLLDGDNRF
jgi:uncharacterized protein (TIGR00266 family)